MILEQKGAARCYLLIHFTLKREENRNRGKRSRHNCKSLRGRLCRISDCIELVRDLSHRALKTSHFHDPVGVVSYRAERLYRHYGASQGKLRHSSACCTVDPDQNIRARCIEPAVIGCYYCKHKNNT